MAADTEIQVNIANAIAGPEKIYQALASAFATMHNTLITNGKGDRFHALATKFAEIRGRASSGLDHELIKQSLASQWQEFRTLMNLPANFNDEQIVSAVADYMDENSQSVNSRNISFGSVADVGSPVGNNTIHRLTVDKYGNPLEGCSLENKFIECTESQAKGTVARFKEKFRMRGQQSGIDLFDRASGLVSGSRGVGELNALHEGSSKLKNPSLHKFAGTAGTPTSLTDWVVTSSISNYAIDLTNYYRTIEGITNPGSLIAKGNDTIYQSIKDLDAPYGKGIWSIPWFWSLRWNREIDTVSAGTITVHWGNKSEAKVIGGSETGWQTFTPTMDELLYPDNWWEDLPKFKIQVSGLSGGELRIDEVIFAPMIWIDGGWWINLGGSTPAQIGDTREVTDELNASEAYVNKWTGILYNGFPER